MAASVTRGAGILEPFLARQRARMANRLIPAGAYAGRILDIGCGSYPYFLSHAHFADKHAIDQQAAPAGIEGITWHTLDLNATPRLPFPDGFFNAITLLAVIEHLSPVSLVELFRECHRVLAPDGLVVLTTPASWSDGLLRWMARVSLVSREEIDEHVYAYTLPLIGWYFGAAGFGMEKVRFGYFEFGLNLWGIAQR